MLGLHTISMMQIKKWYQYVAVAAVGFMLFSLCILESCNKPNQTHACFITNWRLDIVVRSAAQAKDCLVCLAALAD